ncbi:MAG TPA: DNA polymerase III subunit gamma/tau [Ignavibacteria bacterium]|nr:DNA polymerase III subunit gamma/tau [Ignavibacteria bacterium]
MSYIVTARKWRPQKFSEVVGQEHITKTLQNAIKNNRIAHAYLFTGPRGVGKTTTARILAKTLNCLNPVDNEPCNECEMCNLIQHNQSLDIIEIDGASNRGIDDIRALRDLVKYAPTKGEYKIYIIDEVHMLTRESFNAFLKTLEEPPPHTIFIFATTDVHKVPLTIISRCQRFDFRRIQLDTIKLLLSKIAMEEKITINDKALTIIAKKADGALRDAESFFDQIVSFCGNDINPETVSKMLNLIDDEIYFTISDAVLQKNFKAVFDVTGKIYENGWNFIDFISGLIEHFRNIMIVVLTGKVDLVETADIYKEKYSAYVNEFSKSDILRLLNFLNKTQQELRYTQNQKLKIEIALCHLIGLEKTSTISDLLNLIENNEIKNLEDKTDKNDFSSAYPNNSDSSKNLKEVTTTTYTSQETKSSDNKFKSIKSSSTSNFAAKNFNFDTILKNWESFVQSINAEKGLILGPMVQNLKPIEFSGNNLTVYCSNENSKEEILAQKNYLDNKTNEIFGKRISISFTEKKISNKVAPDIPSERPITEQKIKNNPGNKDDPLVKTIIHELGGKELI